MNLEGLERRDLGGPDTGGKTDEKRLVEVKTRVGRTRTSRPESRCLWRPLGDLSYPGPSDPKPYLIV